MKEREMKHFALGNFALLMAFFVSLMFSGLARADTVTYSLDHSPSGSLSWATTTHFGTVTLTQDGSNVDVIVQLTWEFEFSPSLNDSQAWLMYNTSSLLQVTFHTPSSFTLSYSYTGYTSKSSWFGTGQTGLFDNGIGFLDNVSEPGYNYLSFTLDGITIAEFAAMNNGTSMFASSIQDEFYDPSTVWTSCTADPPTATPEPGTMLLLGFSLAGFAAFRMKFRNA